MYPPRCSNHVTGGQLPQADGTADLMVIWDLAATTSGFNDRVWIGADDLVSQGVYKWPGGKL